MAVKGSEQVAVVDRGFTLQFTVSNDRPLVTPSGIRWSFQRSDGTTIELTPDTDTRYTFSSDMLSLTIEAISLEDEGSYTLTATNSGGTNSATIQLDVQGMI